MTKIVAKEGNTFLLVSGDPPYLPNVSAQVADMDSKQISPVKPIGVWLKFGQWDEYAGSDDLLQQIKALPGLKV